MAFIKRIINKLPLIVTLILLPFILEIVGNFIWEIIRKNKTEIKLCLNGSITIGSSEFDNLPNLTLLYNGNKIKNIYKISWKIVNSGNSGIPNFEAGPFIKYPKNLNIISVKIDNLSKDLRVCKEIKIDEQQRKIKIDSLGVFNPGEFIKIDFYFKDVNEDSLQDNEVRDWVLEGRATNLKVSDEIQILNRKIDKNEATIPDWIWYLYFLILLIILLNDFLRNIITKRFKKSNKRLISYKNNKRRHT